MLDRLQVAGGGSIIYSSLGEADHHATGTLSAHSEGLVELLAQSETAEVAILEKGVLQQLATPAEILED